jgi:hypothetical protein
MNRRAASTHSAHQGARGNLLGEIERNYRQLDEGFEEAYAACSTAAQRKQLRATLKAAEDAYWAAVASELSDNNAFVLELRKDLADRNREVAARLRELQDIRAFLAAATDATRLAAALSRLAAV